MRIGRNLLFDLRIRHDTAYVTLPPWDTFTRRTYCFHNVDTEFL